MIRRKILAIAIVAFLFWPGLLFSQSETFSTFDVQPCSGDIVVIQWTSIPESDTFPFDVERSRDKITWEKIAHVPAQASHTYFSIDSDPGDGLVYYRVKRFADAASISYSPAKWVQLCPQSELYIWPNPAKDVLYVKTPFVKGSMDIIDPGGKLMMKMNITNFVTDVPTACLSKGTYFIHIRYDNETLVQKVMKE